jgi:hypothetical protein
LESWTKTIGFPFKIARNWMMNGAPAFQETDQPLKRGSETRKSSTAPFLGRSHFREMNQINIAPEGENSRGFEDIQIFQGFSPPCIKARGKGPRDKFGEFVQFRLKMLLYKFGHPPIMFVGLNMLRRCFHQPHLNLAKEN